MLSESTITILFFHGNSCFIECMLSYLNFYLIKLLNKFFIKLQNAQVDLFIDESLNTLVLKELEISNFLKRQFEDSLMQGVSKAESNLNNLSQSDIIKASNESNSDIFYSNNTSCFNNLIQFDLQSYDSTINKVIIKKCY